MLIYAMGVSVDGYIADRDGAFRWTAPSDELFAFHLTRVRELDTYLCGRKLYETMLPWETDPSMRETELGSAFADVWSALPKVVFSRTLDAVRGNARLADSPVAEEVATALGAGGGTAYLPSITRQVPLDLRETRTFDRKVIYERYRRVDIHPT